MPCDSLWLPFGIPLESLGRPLALLGNPSDPCDCPLGFLLDPWDPFSWLRGTCGFALDHLLELGVTFRANVSFVTRLRTKYRLPGVTFRANVQFVTRPHTESIPTGVTFRVNVSFVTRLHTKYSLPELARLARVAYGNGVKNCTTRPHIHTRRGPG